MDLQLKMKFIDEGRLHKDKMAFKSLDFFFIEIPKNCFIVIK